LCYKTKVWHAKSSLCWSGAIPGFDAFLNPARSRFPGNLSIFEERLGVNLKPPLTLNDIAPGETVRVRDCLGEGPVFQRICEMGFVGGATLRLVRFAPFGDPIEVEIYGTHLSLRRAEAARIEVERVETLEPACGSA
jgi:ferrous iron transport protein A